MMSHTGPPKPTPALSISSHPLRGGVGGPFCGWWDGIKPSSSLLRDTNLSSPVISDELDLALQGRVPSAGPLPLQLTASQVTLHTCVLADPSLSSHISERQNAPGEVTGLRVHFNEGIRAHVTVGIIGDVDRVASGALRRKGRRVGEQARQDSSRSFPQKAALPVLSKDNGSVMGLVGLLSPGLVCLMLRALHGTTRRLRSARCPPEPHDKATPFSLLSCFTRTHPSLSPTTTFS